MITYADFQTLRDFVKLTSVSRYKLVFKMAKAPDEQGLEPGVG